VQLQLQRVTFLLVFVRQCIRHLRQRLLPVCAVQNLMLGSRALVITAASHVEMYVKMYE
jgi:hypothetical protein